MLSTLALLLLYLHANSRKMTEQITKYSQTGDPMSLNWTNWPNSAGMGPGVYKTQSKHTKTKSPYPTGTMLLRNASLCLHIECKSGGRGMSTGELVGA